MMPIDAVTKTYNTTMSTLLPAQKTTRAAATAATETEGEGSTQSASILENSLEKLWGFQPGESGTVSIDELWEQGTLQLEDLNRDLKRLFYENGIDTSVPIELGTQYGTGEVIVKNDHPDKEKIAQLFKDNPQLSNDFKRVSNMLHLAEVGKESAQFQQAYRQNPQQAVEQYGYLFNTQLETTLYLEDGQAQARFQRIPRSSVSAVTGYQMTLPNGLAYETEI